MATQFKKGDKVSFRGAMGVNEIIEIKGNSAQTRELNTGFTYNKRLSSLEAYKPAGIYVDEQEAAHAKAEYRHGATVYGVLDGSGNNALMVWDDIKSDIVKKQDLTQAK